MSINSSDLLPGFVSFILYLYGLGIAVFLLRHGDYQITITEEDLKPGRDVNPFYLWQYVKLLKERKVVLLANTKVLRIQDGNVFISGPSGEKTLETDSIVMSVFEPAENPIKNTTEFDGDYFIIGDAKKPRRLNNAIHDGYRLGMVL